MWNGAASDASDRGDRMPMSADERQARVERYARSESEARRDTRRDMLRTLGVIAFWSACGLALIGMALHVSDATIGRAFWLGGHIVWIAGVAATLLSAYRRGEQRGDW
jgi:fatty acid desaturase